MSSRSLLAGLTALAVTVPATAATAPPTRTPQQAVDAVKRVVTRNMKHCHLDWARIVAKGFESNWTVDVTVRSSDAGKGVGHWAITTGYPVAKNALAKAIAHGCP